MKKIKTNDEVRKIPRLSKLLKVMRITCLFFMLALIQVSASTYSQSTKLSFDLKDVTLSEVFDNIENSSEFRFFYENGVIDLTQKVSVTAYDYKIEEILNNVFNNSNVSFEIYDRYIVIKSNQSKVEGEELVKNISIQQKIVNGRVIDFNGEPLPGVTVIIKGTTQGTVTNADGEYSLSDISDSSILQFSFVGMKTQEVIVGNQTQINIILEEETIGLEEVVAVGYGTIKKSDLTGSVSSIRAEDIMSEGKTTIQQALQGRLAGVSIESMSGRPGAETRILIRGTGSLNNNNPLYLVDGVQVDDISGILPSDIQSMEVLKDASAAAIYGSRASNGVILITTKSGAEGETIINVNAYYGYQQIAKKLDVMNADEWISTVKKSHSVAGLSLPGIVENPTLTGKGTDWQDEVYRIAPIQSYDLSASGGMKDFNYSISGGYLNQDGIIIGSNFDRFNFRVKSDFVKGAFKIGESILLSQSNQEGVIGSSGGRATDPASSSIKMPSVYPVYNPDAIGGYAGATSGVIDIWNPVAMANLYERERKNINLIINLFCEIELLNDLKYKYNVGITNNSAYSYSYTPLYEVGDFYTNTDTDLSEIRAVSKQLLQEHTLNYTKEFNKHRIQALAGYTYQTNYYRGLNGSASGMADGIKVLSAGVSNLSTGGTETKTSLESYFARLIYSFDNRYLFTATFRRDGSSRFSSSYRYGNFPSLALGWNISNEELFETLKATINTLKFRASYGVLGNQEIGDYLYNASIVNSHYVIGTDETLWQGATQTAFATSNIKWEKSETINIGADWGFFDNKLTLSTDYFNRKNVDLLLNLPIALSTGASSSAPVVNAGEISNKGFETAMSFKNNIKDLSFTITGTFTSVKNTVKKLGTGKQKIYGGNPGFSDDATVTQVGSEVGAFWLIHADGIFNTVEEVNSYVDKDGELIQPYAQPGDIRFFDANEDGNISGDDRVYSGSSVPKFEYGLGVNLNYKGFDLNLYIQGIYGNKIYNGVRMNLEDATLVENYSTSLLNAWTPENHTNTPRLNAIDANNNARTSDRFLEDGSYLRLRTLQVGYTIPKALTERIDIKNTRVYLSGDNLITLTKYSGSNPDVSSIGNILSRGVDSGANAYPLSRNIIFGVQLTF